MKKVLIVDDELEFTNDFAKALEMFGYEAYKAGDADSAFSIIENKKPDIVLCDYRLPDIDGDKILEKTKLSHPEIKFVMVTAYYDEVIEKRFRNLGADEVIFKPIVLSEIEALLAKLLLRNKEMDIQEEIKHFLGNKGEIKIAVHTETDRNGQKWVVTICEDTGAGWNWEEMPEDVWERYQYVKKATEKNNGRFDYKAVPGKGAVVTIKFPAAIGENKK